MSKTNTKLIGVQYMRALASMMVLVGHVIAEAEHYFGVHLPLDIIPWTRGVDIFFVISGFIIMVSSQKYYDIQNGVGVFLRNRFVRVVPLYWFFTTLMLVVPLLPGTAEGAGLFVLLACTVAILGSIVVYHLIERPMLALFSRPRRQIA